MAYHKWHNIHELLAHAAASIVPSMPGIQSPSASLHLESAVSSCTRIEVGLNHVQHLSEHAKLRRPNSSSFHRGRAGRSLREFGPTEIQGQSPQSLPAELVARHLYEQTQSYIHVLVGEALHKSAVPDRCPRPNKHWDSNS